MTGYPIQAFAVKTEKAQQAVVSGLMAINGIGHAGLRTVGSERVQHGALLIGRQQRGAQYFSLALLLCQQLILVLDNRLPGRAVYLGGQAALQVKAPQLTGVWLCQGYQSVQGIILIAAEQGSVLSRHGLASSGASCRYPVSFLL